MAVHGLGKSYGPLEALRDVSLNVAAGEFVVLLGPNGAGKTTLFNLITALFHPDAGKVLVNGHETAKNPVAALRGVGVVFQQQTLDVSLTVRQNLMFHAHLHGIPSMLARERMATETNRLGIADRLKTPVRMLNGGHRRRVEIIRALLHRPSLILLDEPTAGLDLASRNLLHDHVRELCAREGTAVLWATHLLEEVDGAQRIHILHKGRILFGGEEKTLLAKTGAKDIREAFTQLTSQDGAS